MRALAAALQFLTIIPLARNRRFSEEDLARSMAFYPLAGCIIGLFLAAVRFFCGLILPSPASDLVTIIALVIVTGALHLDGFADVVDGLAGGRDRKRVLAIMKDSKIGSFAVAGIVLLILLKVYALGSVPAAAKSGVLIVMPVLARWSLVQLAAFFPYAREGGGTGEVFARRVGVPESIAASVAALLIAAGIFLFKGIIMLLIVVVITAAAGWFFLRRIGGVTGDVMGAVNEMNEAAVLLAAAVLL